MKICLLIYLDIVISSYLSNISVVYERRSEKKYLGILSHPLLWFKPEKS